MNRLATSTLAVLVLLAPSARADSPPAADLTGGQRLPLSEADRPITLPRFVLRGGEHRS